MVHAARAAEALFARLLPHAVICRRIRRHGKVPDGNGRRVRTVRRAKQVGATTREPLAPHAPPSSRATIAPGSGLVNPFHLGIVFSGRAVDAKPLCATSATQTCAPFARLAFIAIILPWDRLVAAGHAARASMGTTHVLVLSRQTRAARSAPCFLCHPAGHACRTFRQACFRSNSAHCTVSALTR